jgi:hypothetical protein
VVGDEIVESAICDAGAGGEADVARAVREEDGWNAFVSTAAWWVGEHANSLCGEYAGALPGAGSAMNKRAGCV